MNRNIIEQKILDIMPADYDYVGEFTVINNGRTFSVCDNSEEVEVDTIAEVIDTLEENGLKVE